MEEEGIFECAYSCWLSLQVRRVVCRLVGIGCRCSGNWVGKGRLDLPSNVNPCSGEERLPLFVVLPGLLKFIVFRGCVGCAGCAGGHTED